MDRGGWSIGYGHHSSDVPEEITKEQAEDFLTNDIEIATESCEHIWPTFNTFTQARQRALVDFVFNVGESTAMKFVKMNAAINKGDWITAALEMMDSRWYMQVGIRGKDLVEMLKEG
jgi:lysozyme